MDLLPYTDSVRRLALQAFSPPQRALDALHLAAALDLGLDSLTFISYDAKQCQAAKAAGLNYLSPR